jgi:hypothetical protein
VRLGISPPRNPRKRLLGREVRARARGGVE